MNPKLIVACGLTVLALVAGCGNKPDPLAERLAKIESRLDAQKEAISNLEVRVGETSTNLVAMISVTTNMIDNIQTDVDKIRLLEGLDQIDIERLTSNQTAPRQPIRYSVPAQLPQTFKEGVPIQIYNTIAAQAADKWPSNYDMQNYEIKNQVEAYRKLHP